MTGDTNLSQGGTALAPILPLGVTSFFGRQEQLAELSALAGRARLITLTGAAGIGKSRLGLELARRLASEYDAGVPLVELAAVGNAEQVPAALADALSLPHAAGQSLTETLVDRLRARRVLVVLDNCEHLVDACARLAEALLEGCPSVSILVTSREPLAFGGETVWQVSPLSVPPASEAPLPEVLQGYEAVGLFVDRALAVQPAFTLNAYVAPHVGEICRRLDGLPLSIELAAALSAMLTPAEIARRLDDRFGLLTRGSRSDLPRHQTLQAALDWSHELLSPPEQVLLRRLSVFVGGFCLEACEAVCAGREVEQGEVFDLLARLVSRSLVVADTVNGPRSRYRLLETVRAYASDRLEDASEAARLREAHARFYVDLAEEAEPELTGPDQVAWFERLETSRANLRAALEWSLGHGHGEWALRQAGALTLYWRVRGYFGEGRDLLAASVAAANGAPAGLQAKAQWGIGFMDHMAGEHERAIAPLERAAAHAREVGDAQGLARALLILGSATRFVDEPSAVPLIEESVALAREGGDAWCLAHALGVAGYLHEAHEDVAVARPLFEEAVAVARAARETQGLRYGLYGLGLLAGQTGDLRAAASLLEEAVELMGDLGEHRARADALQWLAQVAFGRGDSRRARELLEGCAALYGELDVPGAPALLLVARAQVAREEGDVALARGFMDEAAAQANGDARMVALHLGVQAAAEGDTDGARSMYEQSLDAARSEGYKRGVAQPLHCLGGLAREEGNTKRAATLHNEALQLQHEIGDAAGVASSLEAIGGLAAGASRHEHAARLFGAAHALREATGFALWREVGHQGDLALVREALSAEQFERAWAQGAGLPLDEAVAQASKGRGTRRRSLSGWSSMTASERRVAALVAEGLTNPEIASRLVISHWTVKTHLSHIFQKLGVTRRNELAREYARHEQERADPDAGGGSSQPTDGGGEAGKDHPPG